MEHKTNFEAIIPIVICLGLFAMVFGIIYLFSREKMAMIERGMNPKQNFSRPEPYKNLKWGLLLIGAGLGLFFAFMLDKTLMKGTSNNEAIYFSLIAIFGGIGLTLSYKVEKKELLDKQE